MEELTNRLQGTEIETMPIEWQRKLLFAARDGDKASTSILLAAIPNTRKALNTSLDSQGNAAIMYALTQSTLRPDLYDAYIKYLISFGINIDKYNKSGYTPLMAACTEDNIRMVNLLLNNGANENLTNNEGKTAATIAEDFHSQHVVDFFQKKRKISLTASQ